MKRVTKLVTIAAAAAVIGWGYQAQAMDVVWGNASGNPVNTDLSGNPLAIGDLVQVGRSASGDVAGFVLFGSGLMGDGTGLDGTFAVDNNINGTSGFFTQQMYIEVFGGANNAAPVALFTNPGWVFPATDPGAVSIDISDPGTVIVSGAALVMGGVASGPLAGGDALEQSVVPEPSSIALVVLGLLGGIGMIRRRQS